MTNPRSRDGSKCQHPPCCLKTWSLHAFSLADLPPFSACSTDQSRSHLTVHMSPTITCCSTLYNARSFLPQHEAQQCCTLRSGSKSISVLVSLHTQQRWPLAGSPYRVQSIDRHEAVRRHVPGVRRVRHSKVHQVHRLGRRCDLAHVPVRNTAAPAISRWLHESHMKAKCGLKKCMRAHRAHVHAHVKLCPGGQHTAGVLYSQSMDTKTVHTPFSCFPACVHAATQPRTSTCPATPPACQLQSLLSTAANMQLGCNSTATHQTSNATSSTRPATTCEQQHQHTSGHAARRMRQHSMVGVGMLKHARHASEPLVGGRCSMCVSVVNAPRSACKPATCICAVLQQLPLRARLEPFLSLVSLAVT
jgi:hypothetical protein